MNVICFVGSSNSGKTTVIENVLPILKEKGLKVLVVKHARHFELDKRGKDSWRLFESGADVVITSKEKTAYISRLSDDIDKIVDLFGKIYDVVIVEGLKNSDFPKIVVLKDNEGVPNLKNVVAVVSNSDVDFEPKFRKDDYHGIAEFILNFVAFKE